MNRLLLVVVTCLTLTLVSCGANNYSTQIEDLEGRVSELESQVIQTVISEVVAITVSSNENAKASYDANSGVLTLYIPRGTPGSTGAPIIGPITGVITTTLAPGAAATADYDPVTGLLILGIPAGETGPAGSAGP